MLLPKALTVCRRTREPNGLRHAFWTERVSLLIAPPSGEPWNIVGPQGRQHPLGMSNACRSSLGDGGLCHSGLPGGAASRPVRLQELDPAEGSVLREPPGSGLGYWAGAPGAFYEANEGVLTVSVLGIRVMRPLSDHAGVGRGENGAYVKQVLDDAYAQGNFAG